MLDYLAAVLDVDSRTGRCAIDSLTAQCVVTGGSRLSIFTLYLVDAGALLLAPQEELTALEGVASAEIESFLGAEE